MRSAENGACAFPGLSLVIRPQRVRPGLHSNGWAGPGYQTGRVGDKMRVTVEARGSARERRQVKITDERAGIRRAPQQERSRLTVEAVLDAVERVLKRDGIDAITTNRIADAAGVSIGSVYQYFPDKRSIFAALHQRHVEQVGQVIERTVAEHASSSVEDFACALVEGLVDVHAADPQLHEIIAEAVPESSQGFRRALQATFERVISPVDKSSHSQSKRAVPRASEDRLLFVLPHLVEALVHGGVTQRPPAMSLERAKQEAVRAVRAYLSASRHDSL